VFIQADKVTVDRLGGAVHRMARFSPGPCKGRIGGMRNRDFSHKPCRPPKRAGFTLVELMVTVAIVAILMAIGAPQLRAFMLRKQVAADVESLTAALQLARSEALKRSGRVSVCALSDAVLSKSEDAACAADGATDWSHGWMVFIDYGAAGFNTATDTVLRVEANVRAGSLTATSPPGEIISFLANGLTFAAQGHFDIQPKADDGTPYCRRMTINRQGRPNLGACD
jgi:type IV fimbrial biogenesis protein FimT